MQTRLLCIWNICCSERLTLWSRLIRSICVIEHAVLALFNGRQSRLDANKPSDWCKTPSSPWNIQCIRYAFSVPCSPPRAAHSHSSSVGSLLPFHWQKAWASFQLTWTTGKPRRSRIPEPGPAGWEAEGQWSRRQEEHAGRCARNTGKQLTCLQNTRSTGSHQGADWTGATSKSVIS